MKIAFGYKARSGKDTACTFLQSRYGGNVCRIAAPVYDILYYAQQRVGLTPHKDRKFLQMIGTEWGREMNPDLWINLLIGTMHSHAGEHMYVPDLRFYNEFTALKRAGFTLVHIVRDECEKSTYEQAPNTLLGDAKHISEHELDSCTEWDHTIVNNGTLDEFYQKVMAIVSTGSH